MTSWIMGIVMNEHEIEYVYYDHESVYIRGIWSLLGTFQDSLWASTYLGDRKHYKHMIDMTCDEIMHVAMNG